MCGWLEWENMKLKLGRVKYSELEILYSCNKSKYAPMLNFLEVTIKIANYIYYIALY